MSPTRRLLALFAPAPPPPAGFATEFLGRLAIGRSIGERRAVIDYTDRDGRPSSRVVTFDEVLDQNGYRYLAGYCHERFDRRHFRLDRVTSLRRFDSGVQVDPAGEVAHWLLSR